MIIELLWFLIIAADVWRNYYIIEKQGNRPDYLQSFIFRGMAAIVHGIWIDGLYRLFTPLAYFYDKGFWEFTQVAFQLWGPVIAFQVFSFGLLFNTGLNLLRKEDFDHIGMESGWIESFLSKIGNKEKIQRAYWYFLLVGFILSWVWFRNLIS